ncbi:MAG: class I SAM-dependent methyltransferase [Candidatus Scalinduaceae bacterium]
MKPEKIYSVYSHFYDHLFGKIFQPGRRIASESMKIQKGEKILEVGIGTGISLPFYPKHAKVIGIDICQEMIEHAEERKRQSNFSNVKLCIMDASKMAFKNNCFDKVIAAHSIAVISEPIETIKEMKRVCKKNAEFYFLNYVGRNNNLINMFKKPLSFIKSALGLGKTINLEELLHNSSLKIVFKKNVNIFELFQIIKCKNTNSS